MIRVILMITLIVMREVHMYPYLHKKHTDLAPKLAEALKAIKEEGLIEEYQKQAVEKVGAAK